MIVLMLLKLGWEQLEEEWTALDGMVFKINTLRWLPRVITKIVFIEREFENETLSISLKVFPRRDLSVWILLK